MALEMTAKDKKILKYVCKHFSCKICNSILIQCVTLSCGHHYCNYCLDLLNSGMPHQCPQCSSSILRAQPNNSIDHQIDNLVHSCSESVQKAYLSALNCRFQKSMERSKSRRTEGRLGDECKDNHAETKHFDSLDEIRNALKMNEINPHYQPETGSLKSVSRNHRRAAPTPSNVVPGERRSSSRHRSKPMAMSGSKFNENQDASEIDMDKVNMLFGIYDHVLNSGNEPNKEMASGDFVRSSDQEFKNLEVPILEGMSNFTQRGEVVLETLIKETDEIVRLDDHIHKWTNKMSDALSGNKESTGIADEKFDKSVHIVDDELWKASSELLQKLQGMQNQRKIITKPRFSFSCPPTPLPRSDKLDLNQVSDDSDVEEYEQALETLQVCLGNSYDLSPQSDGMDPGEEQRKAHSTTEEIRTQQQQVGIQNDSAAGKRGERKHGSSCNRSARKKNILDCMEESGHNYIKENIEFITKMRKYKEALLKIQNHEVMTAQEIKELVPTRVFQDEQDVPTTLKCGDASTARRLPRISRRTNRHPSYSARLPASASMERRPLTATYDLPSTQFVQKEIAVAPTQHYLKQRATRPCNSLFTAR